MLDEYRKMLTIRTVEDRLQQLCLEGKAGDLHFSKGQEAITVGVCSELGPADYMVTHHRTISHSIARGLPLPGLLAELLGKNAGVNAGLAGEMHMNYPKLGFMFSFQLVGTCIPVAAGLAWASRDYLGQDSITALFIGDASTSNGQFHEGMNLASLRSSPLLVVVEDNHLAGNITRDYYLNVDLRRRFDAYDIHSIKCDGNKVEEVEAAARYLAARIRSRGRPAAMICDTTRLSWHKQGQRDIRTPEELAELAKRDPLPYLESQLESRQVRKVKADVRREVGAAFRFALESA